jgi:lipopolysaccharide/colanic/teichoic acid biosynthesis glycosyltransferase
MKRGQDLVLAIILLTACALLLLFISICIAFDSPGPILIRQRRYGYRNVPFWIYKFRTMRFDPSDLSGIRPTVQGDPRVTGVGRFLRNTSLDELPQLLNVLRGEMSLVGPRPHPVDMQVAGSAYQDVVPLYLMRHQVRPGMTGLAQVNGCRGLVDTTQKAQRRLDYDLQYIETWTLRLDLEILVRTSVLVFRNSDAF